MIDQQKKYDLMERILQNKEFKNSEIFKKLLTYLVECSIHSRIPKEYTIATDVFKKESNFDPTTDTTVRVYVHRLRKKLDYYFKTEAKHERMKIVIPKGHYDIRFLSNKNELLKKSRSFGIITLLCAYIVLSHSLYIFVFKPWLKHPVSKLTRLNFWSDFFNPEKPRLVTPGDHFFYEDYRTHTLQRRNNINSKEEFYTYLTTLDSTSNYYWILPFTFFPKNSVWPFQKLQASLLINQKYESKPASLVNANDVNNANILFIGSFHTLGILKETFRNSHFQYIIFPNSLTITDGDKTLVIQEDGNPTVFHHDYGLVRKLPGPNDNVIYIFSSFHETGTIGIVDFFTDTEKIQTLYNMMKKEFGYIPKYFELSFKATGYNRTPYSTEILNIFEIGPDKHFW